MNHRGIAVGTAVLLVVFLGACGEAEPPAQPTPFANLTPALTTAEEDYLESVRALETEVRDVVDEIDEALSTTWALKSRLFDVLREANLTDVFESTLERAEELAPPERFSAEHKQFTELWRNAVELSHQHDRAIESEDLVEVFLTQAKFGVNRDNFFVKTSPEFCTGIAPEELGVQAFDPQCGSDKPLPGGAYGAELYVIIRQYRADFSPRGTSFPLMMSADELFAALVRLNPEIEVAIERALVEARELEPPTEFLADHMRLLQYFEENLKLARAITRAARDGDVDRLRNEYFPESGVVLERAKENFSEGFRPLVHAFFDFE